MTAGGGSIPIKNFEDVIHHDYKVVTNSAFYRSLLGQAGAGSAKHQAYKMHLENKELWKNTKDKYGNFQYDFLRRMNPKMNKDDFDPKTLLYGTSNYMNDASVEYNKIVEPLFALKMDDEVKLVGGHAMQKNSEFLPIFNHYLRKQFETGLLHFSLKTGGRSKTGGREYGPARIPIGMTEPEPLPFNSVQSAFIFLSCAMFTCLVIATREYMSKRPQRKSGKPQPKVKLGKKLKNIGRNLKY